jgi:hypothetical protein
MAKIWDINEAPELEGHRGLDIFGVNCVRTNIIQVCPPVLDYLPSYATEFWHDSHGSLDKLETSVAGILFEWIEAITCTPTQTLVHYTTWWLVPGTIDGLLEDAPDPDDWKLWLRRAAPGLFRGVDVLNVILLGFYPPKKEDACGSESRDVGGYADGDCYNPDTDEVCGPPGEPCCDPYLDCCRAKSGRLLFDSHGSLDAIYSWPVPGPETTIIKSARSILDDCEDECPAGYISNGQAWKIEYVPRTVRLHPGSIPVNTRVEVYDCCECCECICPREPCLPGYVPDCCECNEIEFCIPEVLDWVMPLKSNNCAPCEVLTAELTWIGSGCEWEGECDPPACYNGGTPFTVTLRKVGAAWVLIGPWGTSSPGTVQCCPFAALFAGLDDNDLNDCCVSPCTPSVVNDATVK